MIKQEYQMPGRFPLILPAKHRKTIRTTARRKTEAAAFVTGIFLAGMAFGYLFGLWQQIAQKQLQDKYGISLAGDK